MTAPNHIVGGIAITGISLSFWDINIFSNSMFLSVCIFSSMLPDIDHPKSLIGKIFYPLAKYLDRNFGHRTITHSLAVLVPLFVLFMIIELNVVNPYFDRSGASFSMIFLFAYLSHLILDMLTVQGIPLFYPFMKNPCVIPANPSLRFRSGNLKSEAIALFIFTFVLFSSYDLFKNGFWTTYNRSFGSIKHAYREFRDSENLVVVKYQYSFNGEIQEGEGYILDATEFQLDLWEISGTEPHILIINSKDTRVKNIDVQPEKTVYKYSVNDFNFFNLSIEQLNDTLSSKIVSGKILGTERFIVNNHRADKGSIELEKEVSPRFAWIKKDSLQDVVLNKLKLSEAKLKTLNQDNYRERNKLNLLKNNLKTAEIKLSESKSLYSKNKYEKEIIELKKNISSFDLNLKNPNLISEEIEILKEQIANQQKHHFTGDLKVYFVPETPSKIASK